MALMVRVLGEWENGWVGLEQGSFVVGVGRGFAGEVLEFRR